jgi:hypothetical protein
MLKPAPQEKESVMADSFIPRPDAQALIWMESFANGISANFAAYELSAIDATTISDAVEQFSEALSIASYVPTRTQETVNIKDTKRNAAESLCRQYALQIKVNNGISDALKLAIGVRPVNESREAIYVPQTSPLLNIVANTPGAQTVRYADSFDPEKRGKPFGAASIQLFVAIGDEPIDDEAQAQFVGNFTKNPIAVAFDETDNKRVASYFARWCGNRGDVGPWSLPVSMTIAA